MYCFDSSALAALSLQEEQLESYLEEVVITLDYAFIESLNAIWKRVVLFEEVETFKEPMERLEILRELLLVKESWLYRNLAMEFSSTYRLPVYDTFFIACSISEEAELITLDRKQREVYLKILEKDTSP